MVDVERLKVEKFKVLKFKVERSSLPRPFWEIPGAKRFGKRNAVYAGFKLGMFKVERFNASNLETYDVLSNVKPKNEN